MNGKNFALSADGWIQLTPLGEFVHREAGVTQVVDAAACAAIVADFDTRKSAVNFPGVLLDFDHFSLDAEKSSEAAGWISDLQARPDGLWAKVRWSDAGLAAVEGGRFRLVSPVFPGVSSCEDLGGGRIRPVSLVSVALTNEPNIKGSRPIANRDTSPRGAPADPVPGNGVAAGGGTALPGGPAQLSDSDPADAGKTFMWRLGEPPVGPHCADCEARAGQVKTLREWRSMPRPACHCYCSLDEADAGAPLANAWTDAARAASSGSNWAAAHKARHARAAAQAAGTADSSDSPAASRPAKARQFERGAEAVYNEAAGAPFHRTDLSTAPFSRPEFDATTNILDTAYGLKVYPPGDNPSTASRASEEDARPYDPAKHNRSRLVIPPSDSDHPSEATAPYIVLDGMEQAPSGVLLHEFAHAVDPDIGRAPLGDKEMLAMLSGMLANGPQRSKVVEDFIEKYGGKIRRLAELEASVETEAAARLGDVNAFVKDARTPGTDTYIDFRDLLGLVDAYAPSLKKNSPTFSTHKKAKRSSNPSLANRWAKPWGAAARAASLAVRRANAAARVAASYPDGKPVVRDVTDTSSFNPEGEVGISDGGGAPASSAGEPVLESGVPTPFETLTEVPQTGNPVLDGGNSLIGGLAMIGAVGVGGRGARAAAKPLTTNQMDALLRRGGTAAYNLLFPGGKGPGSNVAETPEQYAARRQQQVELFHKTSAEFAGVTDPASSSVPVVITDPAILGEAVSDVANDLYAAHSAAADGAATPAEAVRESAAAPGITLAGAARSFGRFLKGLVTPADFSADEQARAAALAAVDASKAAFRGLYAKDRAALIGAIDSALGSSPRPAGLDSLSRSGLRSLFASLGGDPDSVVSRSMAPAGPVSDDPVSAAFASLRARHGISAPRVQVAVYTPTADEVRQGFSDFLLETFGARRGNVTQNLDSLDVFRKQVAQANFKASDALKWANYNLGKISGGAGSASPEYEAGVKSVEDAKWDVDHTARILEGVNADLLGLTQAIDGYTRRVEAGSPADRTPGDLDFDAILEAARRKAGVRPLFNRWALPWGDSARAASLAVRQAKSLARARLAGGSYPGGGAVIPDITDPAAFYPAGQVSLSSGGTAADDPGYLDSGVPDPYSTLTEMPRTGSAALDGGNSLIGGLTLVGGALVAAGTGGRGSRTAFQKSVARQAIKTAKAAARAGTAPASGPYAPSLPSASSAARSAFSFISEPFNASRSIITAFDLSAVLRQGGVLSLANPRAAVSAMADMLRSFASDDAAVRINGELMARPHAVLYKQAGLYLTDPVTGTQTKREEVFCSRLAERIPGVKLSERSYNAYLNRLRADVFDTLTVSLCRGADPTTTELKAIANYVNVATGRGTIGELERYSAELGTVFFSPRMVASRFQFLAGQPLYGGSARTRKLIATQYAKYLTALGIIYWLSKDNETKTTFDPRSSDFGKLRVGPTRVDILSGLSQELVFISRLVTGKSVDSRGKVSSIYGTGAHESHGGDSLDIITRFIRTKLSPVYGAAVNLWLGTNPIGKPVTAGSALSDLTVPMALSDVFDVLIRHDYPDSAALSLVSLLGAGVSVYGTSRSSLPDFHSGDEKGIYGYTEADDHIDAPAVSTVNDLHTTAAQRARVLRELAASWSAGRAGSPVIVPPSGAGSPAPAKSRKGVKKMKKSSVPAGPLANRWYVHYGWSDAARAASIAARRAKALSSFSPASSAGPYAVDAAAIASGSPDAGASSDGGTGGTYSDGTAVIPDLTGASSFSSDGLPGYSAGGRAPAYKRTLESNVPDPFSVIAGVPRSGSAAVDGVNALTGGLAMVGGGFGAGPASAGAARASAARRRTFVSNGGDDTCMGLLSADPLNNPRTPQDRTFRDAYAKNLDDIRAETDSEMRAAGLDPQGFAVARSLVADAPAGYGNDPIAEREAEGRAAYLDGTPLSEFIADNGLDLDNDADMAAVVAYRQARTDAETPGSSGDSLSSLHAGLLGYLPETPGQRAEYGGIIEDLKPLEDAYMEGDWKKMDAGIPAISARIASYVAARAAPAGCDTALAGFVRAGSPEAEALSLYSALSKAEPKSAAETDAYYSALEGLNRFTELYDNDDLARAEKEGVLGYVREALASFPASGGSSAPGGAADVFNPGDIPYFGGSSVPVSGIPADIVASARSRAWLHGDPSAEFTLPDGSVVLAHDLVSALDTGNGSVRTFPADGSAALQAATDAAAAGTPLIPALSSKEAQDAARDLGYMHGVYGVEIGELPAIPGDLMGDYDAGRAEGETAKAGPVAAPVDRAAVFRRARAFLDSADGDGFSPDHLNDRFNLDKWGSQPAWATRNQGPKGVYVPGTADTRGDYASVNLMRTAMEWFEDSMTLNPDKKQADAAITYMAALLATISGEANVAKDDMRGEPVESGEGAPADEGGTDTSMPEYDADGNEINATPFYEDSYADPNAVHPLDARTRYSRAGRLGNRALFLANAARTADYYNNLIQRVNEREGARVMAQRAALDRRALSAENRFETTMGLINTRLRDAQAKIPVTAASRMPALQKQVNGLSCAMTRCSAAHAALQATLSARADAISAGRSARAALIAITIQKYTAAAAAAQARADAAAAKKDDDAAKTADGLTGSGGTVAPPLVTAPDAAPVAGPGTVVVPPVKNDDLLNSGCGRGARFRGGPVCNRWWKPNPWGANARAAALAARRAKSAARKAAAKLKIKQDAVAAAAKSEEDWNNSVDAFRACNGDDPAPLLSTAVDAGFSVPDPASVYYHDGNWYDSAGAFIVAGSATASSGPVFRNGYWYDAKTGRTLGKRGKF